MAVWSLIADFFHHSTYFFIKQIIIFFDQSHTFKKELEKKEKETRLASAPRMTKLADDFLAELKQREFKRRSKYPT